MKKRLMRLLDNMINSWKSSLVGLLLIAGVVLIAFDVITVQDFAIIGTTLYGLIKLGQKDK